MQDESTNKLLDTAHFMTFEIVEDAGIDLRANEGVVEQGSADPHC